MFKKNRCHLDGSVGKQQTIRAQQDLKERIMNYMPERHNPHLFWIVLCIKSQLGTNNFLEKEHMNILHVNTYHAYKQPIIGI